MVSPRLALVFAFLGCAALLGSRMAAQRSPHAGDDVFETSDRCFACHNGLRTSSGEDVSIGTSWSTSMMAHSARDPYWQAGVRREVIDHPSAAAAIQDECAACHMPMARTAARMSGLEGEVFAHLPPRVNAGRGDRLAHDGVSCSLCHQIGAGNLGTAASFTGGYDVAPPSGGQPRRMFGPFDVERGHMTIMRSATGFEPTEAPHIRQSEVCATCHTLITKALGPDGQVIGELPEQMPYFEWKHSAYVGEQQSCQSCHMPAVEEETPIASVLGTPRRGLARHTFVGANFFMQRLLARFRDELGVPSGEAELAAAADRTVANLTTRTARVSVDASRRAGGLDLDVRIENLAGHKLPTGYPSRRVWLHVVVRDRTGRVLFESGAIDERGAIAGNDQDADPHGVEPHYEQITSPNQVQIYESVMRDAQGRPTTGLLSATGYAKDNRLLPRGFDKGTAAASIAPVGVPGSDTDFAASGDRVRYAVDAGPDAVPFTAEVTLRYQVIGHRWAENLRVYQSTETSRFTRYYDAMASGASEAIATARAVIR